MTEQNTLSISELEQKANAGDALAQFDLAARYAEGSGDVEQSVELELALRWLTESIQQNHAEACQWLENTYLNFVFPYFSGREDIDQCYKFAFEWLLNGHGQTHYDFEINFGLAVLYAFGKGIEKNQELAIKHFESCRYECHRIHGYEISENFTEIFYNFSDLYKNLSEKSAEKYYFKVLAPFFWEGKSITRNTKQSYAVLPSLRFAFHLHMREFELLKAFFNSFEQLESSFNYPSSKKSFVDMGLTVTKQAEDIVQTNKALQSEIKEKEVLYKALHEKEKEMLSFFTHTMRNALATAPESLRQAIHLLGGEVYEKDTKHYQAINKIAALFSTLSLTDCLIDTFKQSISDPQEFRQSWQNDHTGEASPKWVIASALRQALNRIIFMSDTTELRKLLNNPETALIKATRKSFIEEVLPLNVDNQGVEVFYSWTLAHIPAVEVSIANSDTLNFGVNQIRFSLLFAITSELILNGLKYWDGENRIQIAWQLTEQGSYVFSVKNHCKANASSNLAGTHKGLAFIKRLVELLGDQAQFVCKSEGQLFTAELILTKALFDGES